MSAEPRIMLDIDEGRRLGTLEFNRPGAGNAIDWRFVEELDVATEALVGADRAGTIDVVLLKAAGRHFCVGGDLHEFPTQPVRAIPHIRSMATIAHRSTVRLSRLSIPIVARIQGAAAGAGVGFALLADLPVASERASFTLAYAGVGLVPDGGVSWLLPRAIGQKRATELLLTNRRVHAEEALALGLVTQVVPGDDLDEAIADLVDTLLGLPGDVLRENKRLLDESWSNTLAAHLDSEAAGIAHFAGSAHAQAQIGAVLGTTTPPTTSG